MHIIDWLIVIIPMSGVLALAIYSKRYVRGVVDFLAAGRVARRYVISAGDMASALSVITVVALVEVKYQVGYGLFFWEYIGIPISVIMGLTGFTIYRFRETRTLSIGQFLEMRYNRPFRIVAATIRTLAEMMTNAIGPAVAVNFFIYFLGLPHKVMILGMALPTFGLLVGASLCLCMVILWPAGRLALIITDACQGLMCYPIFVVIAGYIYLHFGWHDTIAPVLMDRVPGESFINPFDIEKLRDFNIVALIVATISNIMNRASWVGNDSSGCGRTPHEQKMASLLGTWRDTYAWLMMTLLAIMLITLTTHRKFADQSHDIRQQLTREISQEAVDDPVVRANLDAAIAAIPVQRHEIGVDAPLSHQNNLDTPYLDTAKKTLGDSPEGNLRFQKFRTLYHQMMLPIALRQILPVGLMGLFCLMMIMLLLSTDDSRILNASATIVQDIVVPFLKKPFSPKQHLLAIRLSTTAVAVFFLVVSLFFVQLDYINMFITTMTALWLGSAGPIMIFGLYSRFGNTTGAFASLVAGSGSSVVSLILQRNWADKIYPWLESHNWVDDVGRFLETVSHPFNPYIVWTMNAVKFPINSYELYFMSMASGVVAYVIGSLLTYQKPYNLQRLFHRGIYDVEGKKQLEPFAWTLRNVIRKLLGITPEYTRGDKIIAWSVVVYTIFYKFCLCFLGVLIWNLISPWPAQWWSNYYFITSLVTTGVIGIISTVWFLIGGIIDMKHLFKDLTARVDNPLDNGMVEGHVSLADKAIFEQRTHKKQDD